MTKETGGFILGETRCVRRRLFMKRTFEVLIWLAAVALFAFAGRVVFAFERMQDGEQRVTVIVKPAQSAEERVADEIKEKELKKAAEEKLAAEESARAVELSPKALLAGARTFYISSDTSFFEPVQLQNALRKRREMEGWRTAILDGDWNVSNVADVLIKVDRPLFTYTFTYQAVHRSTGIVLATGKVMAFDGNIAAPKLAGRIVEEIKKARGESTTRK